MSIEVPNTEIYRIRGNYFVREGRTAEEGTHRVEGYLAGVRLTPEGKYAVSFSDDVAEAAPRRVVVVHLRAKEAVPVLRSLFALVSKKTYKGKVYGLRVDMGLTAPEVYISTKYGKESVVPRLSPGKEAFLYVERISKLL